MKIYIPILLCFFVSATGFGEEPERAQQNAKMRRAELLKRYPKSDTNADGILSAREIMLHWEKQKTSEETKNRLKQMLKRFPEADSNKNDELSWREWRKFQVANKDKIKSRSRRRTAPKIVAPVPDVAYGKHKLQRFDLWPVPDAKEPTPIVIFIHGGGFRGGDKSLVRPETIKAYHQAGIAYASMNYRLSDSGPYPMMMLDAVRGLQTIRHRAKEWNINPERVACYGGSAGAGISLWIAFHDDLADPQSDDPIARISTRILAAGTMNGQSTYDIHTFRKWFGVPGLSIGTALPAFVGVESEEELNTPAARALMKDASPITHLSKDDQVSVYMLYSRPNTKVTKETHSSVSVHHVLLGLKLQEAMKALDLECIVTAPDMPKDSPYDSLEDFLIDKLSNKK